MQCRKCKHADATTSFAGKPVCDDCRNVLEKVNPAKLVAFLAETQNGNGLLTVEQAARQFNLSKRTLYRLVETAELPCSRIGKAIRLRTADLERYLAQSPSLATGSLFDSPH